MRFLILSIVTLVQGIAFAAEQIQQDAGVHYYCLAKQVRDVSEKGVQRGYVSLIATQVGVTDAIEIKRGYYASQGPELPKEVQLQGCRDVIEQAQKHNISYSELAMLIRGTESYDSIAKGIKKKYESKK